MSDFPSRRFPDTRDSPRLDRARTGQSRQDFFEKLVVSAVFQPSVRVRTKEVVGFEALARFYNVGTDETPSPPQVLAHLPLPAHMKLLGIMIQLSLDFLYRMPVKHPVSVNVPPSVLSFGRVEDVFGKIPAEIRPYLKLEVLEHYVEDWKFLRASMLRLRKMGFSFYIDDFGSTEYQDFDWQLLLLPGVEKIKFDKVFVPSGDRQAREAHTRFLHAWATWLRYSGVKILIEGVEDEDGFSQVAPLVDEVQGYFTGRPESVETCLKTWWPGLR